MKGFSEDALIQSLKDEYDESLEEPEEDREPDGDEDENRRPELYEDDIKR